MGPEGPCLSVGFYIFPAECRAHPRGSPLSPGLARLPPPAREAMAAGLASLPVAARGSHRKPRQKHPLQGARAASKRQRECLRLAPPSLKLSLKFKVCTKLVSDLPSVDLSAMPARQDELLAPQDKLKMKRV